MHTTSQSLKKMLPLLTASVFGLLEAFLILTLQYFFSNDQPASKNLLEIIIIFLSNFVFIILFIHFLRTYDTNESHLENLFKKILNGLNDGVFDYNIVTNQCIYSDSYQAMLGYNGKELNGQHDIFYKFVHPEDLDKAISHFHQFLNDEIPNYYNTYRFRHKDGHWIWLLSRGIALRGKNNKIIRLIGTSTDITIQKEREERLAYFIRENELQKLELELAMNKAEAASQAKSDFLATMSHEIRTPMNAVVGLSSLMLKSPLDAKQLKMMEALYTNADILLLLVNDLLDLSRIESNQMDIEQRPFSFQPMFQSLNAMFGPQIEAKGLAFSINDEIGQQTFVGDATRVQQILVNLVNNAMKFTSRGGISIAAGMDFIDKTKTRVKISVSDTGVGIPPEKKEKIFGKFIQVDQTISRRFGGSGLGLAICKSLVELMGGDISVVSTLGKGSVFTVVLPLSIEASAPIIDKPKAKLQHAKDNIGKVLVVEDYESNILVATLVLESVGYVAEIATNGADALHKIETCTSPYHAILMDVQMPKMDGYETTKRLRAIEQKRGFRHLIIGLTAHALADDREKCLAAGMDDYMSKPINTETLLSKITQPNKAA
jgi:PAS domain S-box-containing protein